MSDTEKAPKTGRMFNTNWFDPGWHKGDMGRGSNGREEEAGQTAGQGEAWAAVFDYGPDDYPCRMFISKFAPGAVIHTTQGHTSRASMPWPARYSPHPGSGEHGADWGRAGNCP